MKQKQTALWCVSIAIMFGVSFSSCKKVELTNEMKTTEFNLKSEQTGSTYRIQIYYPTGYDQNEPYHTIYMLDGDALFLDAAHVLANESVENTVLVGIGYASANNRGTDYSFPADDNFPNASGGAKEFLTFLNDDLIPHVENEAAILPKSRMIYGHSLGGFFALYCLFQKDLTNPFQSCIAASPNLMWSNGYLFDLEEEFYASGNTLNMPLYLSVGDIEGASINLYFDAFITELESRNNEDLLLITERLENTAHRNSPIVSFQNGISILK